MRVIRLGGEIASPLPTNSQAAPSGTPRKFVVTDTYCTGGVVFEDQVH